MTRYNSWLGRALITLCAGVLLWLPLRADEVARAGRNIVTKYQDSLVTLQMTLKVHSNMGRGQNSGDEKYETLGTMIDPHRTDRRLADDRRPGGNVCQYGR